MADCTKHINLHKPKRREENDHDELVTRLKKIKIKG